MGNKIIIGDNNKIKETAIAGGDVNAPVAKQKNKFWLWFLKHIEAVVAAIISGATSAFVAWLITYFVLK